MKISLILIIRTAVLKAVREDYAFTKCQIEYPVVFFPDRGLAATGFHLHILEVAAEMLLRFQVDVEVALKPNVTFNEFGKRVYGDPTSAMAYESMYKSAPMCLQRCRMCLSTDLFSTLCLLL